MANIILPAVPVLNEIDNNTKLLIEQAGEINRYPISNLDVNIDIDTSLSMTSENPVQNKVIAKAIADAGSIDIDLDGSNEGEANLINADTLDGYSADEYVRKSDAMAVTKNYSVVGGTDEPTNHAQNMIWIQTENSIGQVYFSGVEPVGINNGDIWIYTGNASIVAFDAIKIGNDTMNTIYPISAKQYISDTWVDKTAKSYQNGEWVDWWDGTIYEAGNLYEDHTGGWSSEGYTHTAGIVSGTIDTGGIHLTGDGTKLVMVGTKEPVDLTGYTKLKFKGIVSSSINNISIEVVLCPTKYIPDFVAEFHLNSTTGQREEEFDIKNFDGEYYIICAAGMSAKCVGTISHMQLL